MSRANFRTSPIVSVFSISRDGLQGLGLRHPPYPPPPCPPMPSLWLISISKHLNPNAAACGRARG